MSSLRFLLALWLGKIVGAVVKLTGRGSATALPGLWVLAVEPLFLRKLKDQFWRGTIVVTGTNGKTTTASLIEHFLKSNFTTIHNQSGSNLPRGIASALIQNANLSGKIKVDFGVFEVDEFALPQILEELTPRVIVLLNLFRDQLDRYGELDTIVEKWKEALGKVKEQTVLLVNADDPQLYFLAKQFEKDLKVYFFGLNDSSLYLEKMPHAADSIFCPKCGGRLTYRGIYLSHLGDFSCRTCGLSNLEAKIKSQRLKILPKERSVFEGKGQKLVGVYNLYNLQAAATTAKILGVPEEKIESALETFQPVFGRQEELEADGKKVKILLSKNPTGFNESIRTLSTVNHPTVLLVLNDLTPDGRDVSWIWDVDFEELVTATGQLIVSGRRTYDLALRLKYAGVKNDQILIESDLKKAIKIGLSKIDQGETLFALPTYSAMLEVRKVLKRRFLL